MNLGRVIGTVVATQKYEGLSGKKFLVVEPVDHLLRRTADPIVAVDTVTAGVGDLIYFVSSREAALACDPWFVPVDAAIVGIVDDVACDPSATLPNAKDEKDVFVASRTPGGVP